MAGSLGIENSAHAGAEKLRVFISYSRDDIDFADQLVEALEVTGFDVTLDRHGISAGEDFQRRLGVLIRDADTIVFVLSPSSAQSEMCAWEVDEAVRLGKRIIPVVCRALEGKDPPPRLKNLDYVFFYAEPKVVGSGFGRGLSRLVAALNTDLDWLREHTRLLARATEWASAGRVQNRMLSGSDIAAAKEWAARRPKGAPEPTALQLDYIRASEDAESERMSVERKRLNEIAHAQAEREEALKRAEVAQQEKAQAARRLARRTTFGLAATGVLALAATAAGFVAWSKQQIAEGERQRAERNLDAITAAIAVIDENSDPRQVAQTFFNLGHTHLSQNRFDEAVTLYKRSLAISEKQIGPQSGEVAAIRTQLALVYAEVSDFAHAEPLLKESLAHYERAANTDHPNVPTILSALADIYRAQGLQAELAEISRKARAIAKANTVDEVPVFFGTDRARSEDANRLNYGSGRGRRLEIGRALVSIPKIHRLSNIERPWTIRIPYFDVSVYEEAEDPKKHFLIMHLEQLNEAEYAAPIRKRLAAATRFNDRAFVFVHGYNTIFDHALYRAAQLAHVMKFDGPAFVYSWPSGGAAASYLYDRESVAQSERYLRKFLELVVAQSGAARVSVIAHSMGCISLLSVLRDLQRAKPGETVIDQLILAAPDIDRENFERIAREIRGVARGMTLYVASNDRALAASRAFYGGIPRAGDVPAGGPVVVEGIDTIDVSADSDMSPSSVQPAATPGSLQSDIMVLLESGLRPPDRRSPRFVVKESPAGQYWAYR